MKQSYLDFLNHNVSPIFYTGIAANPSMGKTAAVAFVQRAHEAVECQLNLLPDKSRQFSAPTVEGFLDVLSRLTEVISMLIFTCNIQL